MALYPDLSEKLVAALAERGATGTCEVCGKNDWAIADRAISLNLTDLSGSFSIPPAQIPTAGVMCNNCGNVRLFALGALGLLPKPNEEQNS